MHVPCVGAVVHDDSGRLLLVRRAMPPQAGRWSVPGGRVEPGESDDEAVRREVQEETGLDVVVGVHLGTVERAGLAGTTYDIRDYACAVTGGTLTAGSDALDAEFVDVHALRALDAAGEVVDGLVEALAGWGALPRRAAGKRP